MSSGEDSGQKPRNLRYNRDLWIQLQDLFRLYAFLARLREKRKEGNNEAEEAEKSLQEN